MVNNNLDYNKPVKIEEGIYWVGFYDKPSGLHCNPYIMIEGEEAVLIDGGSRPDFSTVMLKILDIGVEPHHIKRLIYHHYDPDLCGSIPSLEDIIDSKDLKIISQAENNMFIKYYSVNSPLICIDKIDRKYKFSSGRELIFIPTPYAHSSGSFVTFDTKTGTLFSSDLFGSYGSKWHLFLTLSPECDTCNSYITCRYGKDYCPLPDIINFHKNIMPSEKVLKYAMKEIFKFPVKIIAPQHGSIIYREEDIKLISNVLANLKNVGIDAYFQEENS
jgi:flavorubredoxin